jgi:hypothetical protein
MWRRLTTRVVIRMAAAHAFSLISSTAMNCEAPAKDKQGHENGMEEAQAGRLRGNPVSQPKRDHSDDKGECPLQAFGKMIVFH